MGKFATGGFHLLSDHLATVLLPVAVDVSGPGEVQLVVDHAADRGQFECDRIGRADIAYGGANVQFHVVSFAIVTMPSTDPTRFNAMPSGFL